MPSEYAMIEPAALPRPGPDADAVLLRPAREVLHDQEVGRDALGNHDRELVVETVQHLRRDRVAVALLQAGEALLAQVAFLGGAARAPRTSAG